MLILQISDIHLNSPADAKFPAAEHLSAVIKDTEHLKDRLDAIVLTGDLVDDGSAKEYGELFDKLAEAYGEETPILVTPGNHDNRQAMDDAYCGFLASKHWPQSPHVVIEGSLVNPGSSVIRLDIYDSAKTDKKNTIVLMDSGHRDYPYNGLARLNYLNAMHPAWGQRYPYILFTHMPIIRPFHRFMNDASRTIADDDNVFMVNLESSGCTYIACGHYQCQSHSTAFGIQQFVAPAVQVQIDPFAKDPFAKDCHPSGNFPGYTIISDHGVTEFESYYVLKENNP